MNQSKDYFIILDKPPHMTSQTVVNKIKRKEKLNKVGHNGTLDPETTGVMLVACNRATRLLQYLENEDKTYITTILFGINTDTLDVFGNTLDEISMDINEDMVNDAINKMLLIEEQIPPIVSAVKVNGRKLMDYHRKNIDIEIKPRKTRIFEINKLSNLRFIDDHYEVDLELKVAKGFYIRSFARDLGELLGGYGIVKALRRTKAGEFDITNAVTLDDVLNDNYKRYEIDDIFTYPVININDRILKFVQNGVTLYDFNLIKDCNYKDLNNLDRFYLDYNNKHIAIYHKVDKDYRPIFIFSGESDGNN